MPDPSLNPFIIESRHPARSATPPAPLTSQRRSWAVAIWTGVISVAAVRLRCVLRAFFLRRASGDERGLQEREQVGHLIDGDLLV